MNVAELITWLQTQDQEAIVEVNVEYSSYSYAGDEWYTSIYTEEFDPHAEGHVEFNKKRNTMKLGGIA